MPRAMQLQGLWIWIAGSARGACARTARSADPSARGPGMTRTSSPGGPNHLTTHAGALPFRRRDMLTVAVIAQKGGVGKTTLALHLAVEAAKGGRVVIIDTDPQASAAQWADERQAPQPAVVTCPASRLPVSLHTARQSGAHTAFIDTAPAVESPALAAVRAA